MDLKNQIELELYFADHFDTILFPVLADIYFNQEDYRRARKVCNIGLGYHENDAAGRFVLAKIEKAEGNLKDAEKELKHVLKYSPDNIDAAIMYCEIQTVLGRSPSRLLTSWFIILIFGIDLIVLLTSFEKLSLSTAKAEPAGTLL